jgi:hypothetical protein
MEHEFAKRRRSPRVCTEYGTIVALHVSVPVRLLDLSPDGLLMACEVPLRVGSTVRVVTGVTGRRLAVELCVDPVSNRPDEGVGGYLLWGRLPSSDLTARQVITALLSANGIRPDVEPAPRIDRGRSVKPDAHGVRRERPVRRPEHARREHASWISPAR